MAVSKEQVIDFLYERRGCSTRAATTSGWLSGLRTATTGCRLTYKQTDPHLVTSLLYEDHVHAASAGGATEWARTFSQKPKSRCHHVIQRPFIDEMSDNRVVTNTSMHYVETRLDEQFSWR